MIGTILMVGGGLYVAGVVGLAILCAKDDAKKTYIEEKALDDAYKAAKEDRLDSIYYTNRSSIRTNKRYNKNKRKKY